MRVVRWNFDKPHRCPACHAIAVSVERPKSWRVYQCCQCRTRFTRWPRLARLLPNAGITCSGHQDGRIVQVRHIRRGPGGKLTVNPGDPDQLDGRAWQWAIITRDEK